MTDELTLKYLVQFLQLDSSYTVQIKQSIQEEIDNLKENKLRTMKMLELQCTKAICNF